MIFPAKTPPAITRSSFLFLALLLPLALACRTPDHDRGPGENDQEAGREHQHGDADDHDHDGGEHEPGDGATHAHGDDDEHAHDAGTTHTHDDDNEHAHGGGATHAHDSEGDAWAVTAFGERFEIFAEAEPLAVGAPSRSHTHVTVLDGFSALEEGRVEAVLTAPGLEDQVFTATAPVRAGIFDVVIEPRQTGTFGLHFRVEAAAGNETIDAGTVRVGPSGQPGGLIAASFTNADDDGEPTAFLKEQQWKTAFATAWVRPGALADTVRGPATVRPPAGGEVVLTAPVDGVLSPAGQRPWPHAGRSVREGEQLFAIVPRAANASPLANLEAEVTRGAAELETRRARLERLEKLLEIEAVSRREVEEVRTEVVAGEADLTAAQQNLSNERSARRGGKEGAAGTLAIEAPFAAQVAAVQVSPGETVSAGTSLARLVVRAPLWIEVRLPPGDAEKIDAAPSGLLLRSADGTEIGVAREDVELVAQHPEVDAATGTVGVIFALRTPPATLIPGMRAEAEVLLPTAREGIVIPRAALVDDSGVDVVYVQRDGESFARREVTVLARHGEHVLVEDLRAGERLVVRGGPTLRRTALLATGGTDHGHVH